MEIAPHGDKSLDQGVTDLRKLTLFSFLSSYSEQGFTNHKSQTREEQCQNSMEHIKDSTIILT
jgi:hypothetical protein